MKRQKKIQLLLILSVAISLFGCDGKGAGKKEPEFSIPEQLSFKPSAPHNEDLVQDAKNFIPLLSQVQNIEGHILQENQDRSELPAAHQEIARQIDQTCQVIKSETPATEVQLRAKATSYFERQLYTTGQDCDADLYQKAQITTIVLSANREELISKQKVSGIFEIRSQFHKPEHQRILAMTAARYRVDFQSLIDQSADSRRVLTRASATGRVNLYTQRRIVPVNFRFSSRELTPNTGSRQVVQKFIFESDGKTYTYDAEVEKPGQGRFRILRFFVNGVELTPEEIQSYNVYDFLKRTMHDFV